MTMTSIRCPVLGADVACVTDLEGSVLRVICEEYGDDGTCRLKTSALRGGPLAQLLERVSEHTLDTHGTACSLRARSA
jgi:hypothetical protein